MTTRSLTAKLPPTLAFPVVSVIAGAAVVVMPASAAIAALLLLAALVAARPHRATVWLLAAAALHHGLFVYYSLSVAGIPISFLDAVPWLLLLASLSLRRFGSAVPREARAPTSLRVAAVCLVGGVVLGVAAGAAYHAPLYQLLRVVRIEIGLLVGLLAAVIGARMPAWRRAFRTGLVAAALTCALQILVSFAWYVGTGRSFWSLFPFGTDPGELATQLGAGNVNALRTNDVSTYLMLPGLCIAAADLRGLRNRAVVGLVLAASIVSLSRGFWFGLALTVFMLALVTPATAGRTTTVLRWLVVGIPVIAAVVFSVGGILQMRIRETFNPSDSSTHYRLVETRTALSIVGSSPTNFVFGTGAGVILPLPVKTGYVIRSQRDVASFLENSLLSRWTNLSILSALGTCILLLGAWRVGTRGARIESGPARAVAYAGACLPAVLVGGLFGGTLESQASLAFWMLAGAILAQAAPVSARQLP